MPNIKRIERKIALLRRRQIAYSVVLEEIRKLQERYADSPDVVEALISIEKLVQGQLQAIYRGLNTQLEKYKRLLRNSE